MEKSLTNKGPTTRYLAIFDAIAFVVVAALFIWLILSPEQSGGVTGPQVAVPLAYLLGAALLLAGALKWYGQAAWILRLAGFLLIFIPNLANISFAFITIPLSLLAIFSIGKHERGELRRRHRLAPWGIIIALGAITLSLSVFLPWYGRSFQDGLSSYGTQVSLWDASTIVAAAILAVNAVALGILLSYIASSPEARESANKPRWSDLILLSAVAVAAFFAGFRMLVIPVSEGAMPGGVGPGFVLGLAGIALLLFGAFLRLITSGRS